MEQNPEMLRPMADEIKLFLGGLPEDITEDEIRALMSTHGNIAEIFIMHPSGTSRSRCAFVRFKTRTAYEMSQSAITTLHQKHKMRQTDDAIVIRYADGKDALTLKQTPPAAGGIDPYYYGADSGAMGMIAPTPDMSMMGMGGAGAAPWMGGGAPPLGGGGEPKLFVGNLPANTTEDDLRQLFSTYGPVEDVKLMKPSEISGQRCAFVIYPSVAYCQSAIDGLANYRVLPTDEKPILVRMASSQGRGPRPAGAAGGPAMSAPPPIYGGPGGAYGGAYGGGGGAGGAYASQPMSGADTKLFIGNLPGNTTEDDLRQLFSTYGPVEDCRVMAPSAISGQRCAFVIYPALAHCQAAIDGLANYRVLPTDDKPIVVRMANNQNKRPRPF